MCGRRRTLLAEYLEIGAIPHELEHRLYNVLRRLDRSPNSGPEKPSTHHFVYLGIGLINDEGDTLFSEDDSCPFSIREDFYLGGVDLGPQPTRNLPAVCSTAGSNTRMAQA